MNKGSDSGAGDTPEAPAIDLVALGAELRPILERLDGSKGERLACAITAFGLALQVDGATFLSACTAAGSTLGEFARNAPRLH